MSDITINDQSNKNSLPFYKSPKEVSKQMVIEVGMDFLQGIGSDHICKVCIANGGSCCSGCRHLANRTGCQLRNTSCTAWLCGFLKYVLYEMDLLQEWNEFWDQVPGLDYREDYTPEHFFVEKSLSLPNMGKLSEALALDLIELVQAQSAVDIIVTLREKLDHNIDQWMGCKNDPKMQSRMKRNIKTLSVHFHHFHKASSDYRQSIRLPG